MKNGHTFFAATLIKVRSPFAHTLEYGWPRDLLQLTEYSWHVIASLLSLSSKKTTPSFCSHFLGVLLPCEQAQESPWEKQHRWEWRSPSPRPGCGWGHREAESRPASLPTKRKWLNEPSQHHVEQRRTVPAEPSNNWQPTGQRGRKLLF